MNEERDLSNCMRAITISHEYGSGGGEIASRLARRLGWHLIDHAIVERVASELGTSQEEAKGLAKTMGELGPAIGVSQYPGQPEDFRPPAS